MLARSCRRILREIDSRSVCSLLLRHFPTVLQTPQWRPLRDLRFSSASKKLTRISSSLKHWLGHSHIQQRKAETEDNIRIICDVLLSRGRDHPLENTLSHFNLRLTEECVIKVLKQLQKNGNLFSVAVRFFDWAGQQRDYQHTTAAHYVFFKALRQSEANTSLLYWLKSFEEKGNVRGAKFYEILILGYALAGESDVALRAFARMRFQGLSLDGVGYNALLKALVDENCFHVVEILCRQISGSGSLEFIMMRNLCKQGRLEEAKEFLYKVSSNNNNNKSVDDCAITMLITSFCEANRSQEALGLIEELRRDLQGRVSIPKLYGALIRGLVEEKKVNEALQHFEEAKGFTPGGGSYNALVSGLLQKIRRAKFKNNRIEKVCSLLNEMKTQHLLPNRCAINNLICLLCRRGMVDIASDLFNNIGVSPFKETYDMLIAALCRARKLDAAQRVLENEIAAGFRPSKKTFFVLSKTLHDIGNLDEVQGLIDRQYLGSNSSSRTFISALCNTGKIDDRVLVAIKTRSNVLLNKNTYSALIHAFCVAKKVEMASQLLLEMQAYGHSPSHSTFKHLIKVLCETSHSDHVVQLLDMYVSGGSPNAELYNVFISGLCDAGHPDIAMLLFKKMHGSRCPPNTNTCLALLHGYLKCRQVVDALNFFGWLSEFHPPHTRLYSLLISGLCKAGNFQVALMYWEEIRGKGMIPKIECCEDLIYVFCMVGMFTQALQILADTNAMKGRLPSTYMYNVVFLHSFKVQETNWPKVLSQVVYTPGCDPIASTLSVLMGGISNTWDIGSILEELIEQSFVPNVVTFNLIIGALCRQGKMKEACNLFNNMSKKGCTPNVWTYDILVHGFCKVWKVNEAQLLMNEMIEKGFNPSIWTYKLFRSLANRSK